MGAEEVALGRQHVEHDLLGIAFYVENVHEQLAAVGVGVVWCGVVWCGVVWRGVVWCGVVWCGVVWCDVVWCGVVRQT